MTRRSLLATRSLLAVTSLLAALAPSTAEAQQILVDRATRAAGLWCFPLAAEPKTYVYLPSSARLATDEAGRPQFSFVRYVAEARPAPGAGAGEQSINTSGGGGILHFLVLIDTPEASVVDAQKVLRQTLKDDDVTLRGPVVFADGRYALVSSVLIKPDAPPERKLLASGRAPVFEGNRLAFSFDLSPEQATLLHKSMQMRTPDISIVFDMTFTGLNEAYDADLTINWSEVRNSQSFGAGGSVYFIGGDVELAFDELRRNNAIKLRSSGSDATMEALLTTVYSKLLELLFKPVEPERVPEGQRGGLMSALNTMLDSRGALGSRRTTGFGLNVSYQLKDMRSSGVTTLNFNHRATVERHSFITFNIGDLYAKYGKDTAFFRDVSLEDPTFRQREIQIGVDGALLPEFERYINGVTLTLRKQHQNGQETLREIVLDRRVVQADAGKAGLKVVYTWNGDEDRAAWLQYDYRTRWSFKGGGSHQTDWTRADAPMIDLFTPYERRIVQIVGDRAALKQRGVRAVVVEVSYPFFGERRTQTIVVRPDQEPGAEPSAEITLPLGQHEYGYVITWQLEGNRRLTAKGTDSGGIVFIDDVPAPQAQDLSGVR
jgi:hypothetical protein